MGGGRRPRLGVVGQHEEVPALLQQGGGVGDGPAGRGAGAALGGECRRALKK